MQYFNSAKDKRVLGGPANPASRARKEKMAGEKRPQHIADALWGLPGPAGGSE